MITFCPKKVLDTTTAEYMNKVMNTKSITLKSLCRAQSSERKVKKGVNQS